MGGSSLIINYYIIIMLSSNYYYAYYLVLVLLLLLLDVVLHANADNNNSTGLVLKYYGSTYFNNSHDTWFENKVPEYTSIVPRLDTNALYPTDILTGSVRFI